MTEETKQRIIDIKKELRTSMNGVASSAMRRDGLEYRVNFGVELPRIQAIAADFAPDHELAQQLWKEEVRECKILATMLQPKESFLPEIADIWVESIRTVEMAQLASINLFRHMDYASTKAFEWIAQDNEMIQICGYYTLCHLFRQSALCERSADEFTDQANTALSSDNPHLRNAARRALNIFRG